jgi:type VI secretion system secreted protein VgrG
MSSIPVKYSLAVGQWEFWVRELEGVEELSKPFHFKTKFFLDRQSMTGEPSAFDPDLVIKEAATLILRREEQVARRITGVITHATLSAVVQGDAEVALVFEPRLALLGWRTDIRTHRNQSVPEIVSDVVQALGVEIELRLRESYVSRPYCVQYRETDLDYVHRLLEDEGIFYFFTEDGTMVLGDSPDAYQPITGTPTLPFFPPSADYRTEEAVNEIGSRATLTPAKVTLRDWNTEHPSLNMDMSHATQMRGSEEWYDYPGEYENPGEGARKARLHAEAFDRQGAATLGASTSARIHPGSTFLLLDVPDPDSVGNQGEHVIRKVEHKWNRLDAGFGVRFESDGSDVTYRPARTTFVPRTFNPVTGFVCTDGQDIQCDRFGRVKVHFQWDRIRPHDDDCSHWVPVVQDNTGGSSAIPRRGWEMLVHYLEGDPDRPVVLGRVYNGADPPEEPLPEEKTKSSLKSLSTPSRDGKNEILFDDLAGRQVMRVVAQKDQLMSIANDLTEATIGPHQSGVDGNESVSIGGNTTWNVGADWRPAVGGNQTYTVGADVKRTVTQGDAISITGDRTITIGGNHERKVYSDDALMANSLEEQIGADVTEEFQGKHDRKFGKEFNLTIGGSSFETALETKTETTSKFRKETVGGMHLTLAKGQFQMRVTDNRTTTVGGFVYTKAKKELTLTGAEKFKSHSPSVSLNGSTDITLKVGETVVVMKDGVIRIDAPEKIALVTQGANNQGAGKSRQI